MAKKLRAKFTNGVLTPLDKLDLEEGTEVTVSIDDEPELTTEDRIEILKSTAGAWEKNSEYWERTKEMLYESRLTGSRTARLSARSGLKRYASTKRRHQRGLHHLRFWKRATQTADDYRSRFFRASRSPAGF